LSVIFTAQIMTHAPTLSRQEAPPGNVWLIKPAYSGFNPD